MQSHPDRLRIGVVPYLNMLPLVAGLDEIRTVAAPRMRIEVASLAPGPMIQRMDAGEIDIGMAPLGALFERPEWRIVGRTAIVSRGPVKSVLMLGPSDPFGWKELRPDSQSRSSNVLARILLDRLYDVRPEVGDPVPLNGWEPREADFADGQACVLIGTRALRWRDPAALPGFATLDMGTLWRDLTGLPFVYAAWAVRDNAGPDPELLAQLLSAVDRLPEFNSGDRLCSLIEEWPGLDEERLTLTEAYEYLTENIRYDLDEAAFEGIERYYAEGRRLGLFPEGWSRHPARCGQST